MKTEHVLTHHQYLALQDMISDLYTDLVTPGKTPEQKIKLALDDMSTIRAQVNAAALRRTQ